MYNKKNIAMLLMHDVTNDARVLKEIGSMHRNGYKIDLLTIVDRKYHSNSSEYHNIQIKRVLGSFFKFMLEKAIWLFKKISLNKNSKSKKSQESTEVSNSGTFLNKVVLYIQLLRILFYTPIYIVKLYKIRKQIQVVHCHDLETLLSGVVFKIIARKKVVYDAHELFEEQTSYIPKLLKAAYRLIERFGIKKVDAVITVNEIIATELKNKHKLKAMPYVLYNCPMLNDEHLELNDDLKNKTAGIRKKAGDKKIVIHIGGIYEGRGLENLVRAFKYTNGLSCLLFLGRGANKNTLQQIVQGDSSLQEVVFFEEPVPNQYVTVFSKIADASVLTYPADCKNNCYASPNKLFESIHSELPIIANDLEFVKKVVNEYKTGCIIPSLEPKVIAKSIDDLFNSKDILQIKENIKKAKKIFNWQNEEKKLLNIYQSILK